jgi:predicted RNA-binding Zn-ribbon protein involved in translation (DUF1610 family)
MISIEILAHFKCDKCQSWFSKGDPLADKECVFYYCPNCLELITKSSDIKQAIMDKINAEKDTGHGN